MSKTTYICWKDDYDGGPGKSPGEIMWAYDAEMAAEKFCELHRSDWDYPMDDVKITVAEEGTDPISFAVSFESIVQCRARKVLP